MRCCLILIACLVFPACKEKSEEAGIYDAVITQSLSSGEYEEFFLEAKYLKGVDIKFNIKPPTDTGQFDQDSSIGILLKSEDRSKTFKFIYYIDDEAGFQIQVVHDEKLLFDEYVVYKEMVNAIKVTFDEENVYIESNEFKHAMNLTFEAEFLALKHVSAEIINNIDFIYRTK